MSLFWSMAAMLGNSAVVVVRTRPRAIPLAKITMRKSTHGFPLSFPCMMSMGLRLAALWAAGAPLLIVSITKFSIMIGSPHAYLSRIRRSITWVSNYRCSIWTFCKWIPTRFSCQLRALKWIPSQCLLQFSKLMKSATDVFAQKNFQQGIFNSKICYRYD